MLKKPYDGQTPNQPRRTFLLSSHCYLEPCILKFFLFVALWSCSVCFSSLVRLFGSLSSSHLCVCPNGRNSIFTGRSVGRGTLCPWWPARGGDKDAPSRSQTKQPWWGWGMRIPGRRIRTCPFLLGHGRGRDVSASPEKPHHTSVLAVKMTNCWKY